MANKEPMKIYSLIKATRTPEKNAIINFFRAPKINVKSCNNPRSVYLRHIDESWLRTASSDVLIYPILFLSHQLQGSLENQQPCNNGEN